MLKDPITKQFLPTHGMSSTHEYSSYQCAKGRCQNPKVDGYARYGGRGIEMRFMTFEEFFAEAGYAPTPQHTINRIDNNGHYEKGNVEWATPKEQAQNRVTNIMLTFKGATKHISDWERSIGVKNGVIQRRIRKHGWCVECAIGLPVGKRCCHRPPPRRQSKRGIPTGKIGTANGKSKPIVVKTPKGETLRFESGNQAAISLNLKPTNIIYALRQQRDHLYGGYTFQYAEGIIRDIVEAK